MLCARWSELAADLLALSERQIDDEAKSGAFTEIIR
jgi:hypothetical protein